MSGSVVRLFTKCVSNPFPATQLQLFSGRLLVWFVEQFFVGEDLRPADLQDASQALVNEGFYLRGVVGCCSPYFAPNSNTDFTLVLKNPYLCMDREGSRSPNVFNNTKATLAFPILAITSASVPPNLSTMRPRKVKLSTFSKAAPSSMMLDVLFVRYSALRSIGPLRTEQKLAQ